MKAVLVTCLLGAGDVRPFPTPAWLAVQVLPALAVEFGAEAPVTPELRWQLTPVSWSWGTNVKARRWRAFIVEPRLRHGGSVELSVSPVLRLGAAVDFTVRPALRLFLPLLEYGEALSLSVALHGQRLGGVLALGPEVGAYVLFGILGVVGGVLVDERGAWRGSFALQVRAF